MSISVLAMPMWEPGQGRVRAELPEGLTIDAILGLVLADLPVEMHYRLRVILTDGLGRFCPVPQASWRRVRPRAGIHVVVRLLPAGENLRSVLLAAVSIAAVALGQFWAPSVVGALGLGTQFTGLVAAGLTAGIAALGGLLVNALVPARTNARDAEKPTFAISGWRNGANPGGVVPAVMGRHRLAPNFAAGNYTEIVGDDQYVRALFIIGYGPVVVSDIRIGETPIANFSDVEYEVRQGYADDEPCHLYSQQVIEESLGVELRRDYPRDGSGNPVTGGGAGAEDPVSRVSAADVAELAVLIGFPAGLVRFDDQGDPQPLSVALRLEQRPVGGSWSTVTTLSFTGRQSEAFFRVHRWPVPSRGRYEVKLVRVTEERTSTQESDRTVWVALQGFRPEYPINFGKPLALLAMRVKATHQLNGALDTVNLIASRIAPHWSGSSWSAQETRNPAALYRWALQGPAATFPEADSGMDLTQIEDWHEYCEAHDLKYDRIHDFEASQWDVLADIAAAGRASPRHDGRKWGVVIDRAGEPIIDHLNSGNASDFSWARTYVEPPHGFRVQFLDSTNDFRSMERVVPWPGHAGDVEITQKLQLPGKTDPIEVFIETRRRQHEINHRPDRFRCVQAGSARKVTRGDRVIGAFDTLEHTLVVLPVRRVMGNLIELTGSVTMSLGEDYACRYRVFDEDGVMSSVLRGVVTQSGERMVIEVTGTAEMPEPGELVHFGIAGRESIALIVTAIEAGDDMTSIVTAVAEAPQIDELTNAEIAPPWDGRVGGAVDNDTTAPAAPKVRGVSPTGDGFTVLLAPGAGAIPVASFAVRHRLEGAISWSGPVTASVGSGAVTIGGYDPGDEIDWEAQAISPASVGSSWTATAQATVPLPVGAPDPFVTVSVTPGLGHASLVLATPADPRIRTANIYRNGTATFGTATLVASLNGVLPSASYGHIDGDATRTNLVANPGFDGGASWTLGTDWLVAVGKASKLPGASTAISQAIALVDARTYRYRVTISEATDGILAIKMTGGTDVVGSAETGNGTKLGSMTALVGNDTLSFLADVDFDGSIDSVVLFEESPTSVAQGTHYYFITAANADGDESAPLTLGPFTIV